MPIDPQAPFPIDTASRQAERLADLERRLQALERGSPAVQTGTGSPSSSPRDGTLYGRDTGNGQIWLRIGGVWRFVALT